MQQWAGLCQIRQIFHNTRSVRYSAMGRAVSDQTDLPQHKECPLFSDGQGCLRSDRSSTKPRVVAMQQWAGLSQIGQIFHNSRSVCCYATVGVVSDQIDVPQHKGCLLFSDGQECVRSDRSSTTPMGSVVRRSSRPSTKPHSGSQSNTRPVSSSARDTRPLTVLQYCSGPGTSGAR